MFTHMVIIIIQKLSFMYGYHIQNTKPYTKCDLKIVIFNVALPVGIFKSSYDNVLREMPEDLADNKSTLVQVIAGSI